MIRRGFQKPSKATEAPAFEGYVDGYFDGFLHGWIRDANSSEPVQVDISISGKLTHKAVSCDQHRGDLRAAGLGQGNFGFQVRLDVTAHAPSAKIVVYLAGSQKILASRAVDVEELAVFDLQTKTKPEVVAAPKLVPKASDPQAHSKEKTESTAPYKVRLERLLETQLSGWMINTDQPDEIFSADVFVDGAWYCSVRNDTKRMDLKRLNLSNGRGGIDLMMPQGLLKTGQVQIGLRVPTGQMIERTFEVTCFGQVMPPAVATLSTPVSIIVPIFNAFEDLEICLKRVLAHTTEHARLILIDDASTDKRVAPLLATYADHDNIVVLSNHTNIGFTRTINRGIAEAGQDDVIFLNSDARVTPGWLEGLRAAAASDVSIGTVTPLSDRAGAFSAPDIGNHNPLPFGVSEPEYAVALRRQSLRLYPTVPTGNGFCMYVRRGCIDAVGRLDEEAFPLGYGEENDFCMRSGAAGWRNIIDDATYVFHERSKSFGDQKSSLMEAGRKVVDARFPDYQHAIKVFGNGPQVALARYRARRAQNWLSAPNTTLPRAMFVIATTTGGTPQTNRDLMEGLSDAWECWLLRCDKQSLTLSRMSEGDMRVVEEHQLQEAVNPTTHTSFEYDRVVACWLARYGFDLVHIRQLIWHSLSLPRLAKQAGAMVINSFHDFYTVSPSVKLLDQDNRLCGVMCPDGKTYADSDLWPQGSMPPLDKKWVKIWQAKFTQALADCDAFVTTSPSARDTILSVMPPETAERFVVIPHGRDFGTMRQSANWPNDHAPIRILLPGNISHAKGRAVVEALLDRDVTDQRLKFHILGDHDFPKPRRGLHFHGTYERGAFGSRVAQIAPHVGGVLSIWDETYCHTLTEMWAAGLPVVGLEYPTVASRIRNSGAGWVYSDDDLDALYARLVHDLNDIGGFVDRLKSVTEWQRGEGHINTTRAMASKYNGLYRIVQARVQAKQIPFQTRKESPPEIAEFGAYRIAVVCPSDNNLEAAPASTHVRVWARTFNTPNRAATYVRMTPDGLLAAVRIGDIDKAIIQRNAIPARLWRSLEEYVVAGKLSYVFDIDDDLLNVPADKDPNGSYDAYAPVLRDIITQARAVTVSTAVLGKLIAPLNDDVTVLPNMLSGRIWRGDVPERKKDGALRGVYMGNRSHDEDFELVRPAFETMAEKHPNLRLRLIGALQKRPDKVPSWLEIVDIPKHAQNYPAFLRWLRGQCQDLDFGIAPLADTPFNAHKSYLKVLDYAALELPVIASQHPVYKPLDGAEGVVLANNSDADWGAKLLEMIESIHNGNSHSAMRDWVSVAHLLEDTLDDYDTLIVEKLCKERT